jgi:hypothetical protein
MESRRLGYFQKFLFKLSVSGQALLFSMAMYLVL